MFESLSPLGLPGAEGGSSDSQQGFTLIEMSIVLVIIGLIIGGIVKGEEVVASARLKIQISQMDAIKGAVFTFQDKYGYLPGDFLGNAALGLAATTDGNQDGFINAGGTGTVSATLAESSDVSTNTESPNVWLQLSQAGLLAGIQNIPTGSPLSSATGALYPGKIANSYVWVANYTTSWGIISEMARLQQGTKTPSAILRESDAYSIDSKFDDGTPGSGDIIAVSLGSSGCASSYGTSTPGSYSQGAVNVNTYTCALDFILQ